MIFIRPFPPHERRVRGRSHRQVVAILVAPAALLAAEQATAQPLADPTPLLAESREDAVKCLATAIVYEAATEPLEGQQAVAQVIMNRTRSAAYPPSICGVVYQGSQRHTGCQFTFTCDGSLRRPMSPAYFAAARTVAEAAFDGTLPDRVGGALNYHAHYVTPRWAPTLDRIGRIGAHIFYQPGSASPALRLLGARAPMPRREPQVAQPPFAPWGLVVAHRSDP